LIDHLQMECSSSKDSIHLYERCKTLVLSSSKTLKKWGLLKKKDGDWKRNKKFEPVWRLRQDRWKQLENCQLLGDNTSNILESGEDQSSSVWSVWSPPPRDLKRVSYVPSTVDKKFTWCRDEIRMMRLHPQTIVPLRTG
jgi:hypothetical protein